MPSFSAWRTKLPPRVMNAFSRIAEQEVQYLVVRELVGRRQQRMGLGGALDLLDLGQPLVAVAQLGPGLVDRAALEVDLGGEHDPAREIGIVRDRQELVPSLALLVHPVPEIRRRLAVERAERPGRDLGAILEVDVAVHVPEVRRRRPLVGAEGRELAGLVGGVRGLVVVLPDRVGDLRLDQFRDRFPLDQAAAEPEVDLLDVGRVVHDELLGDRQLADRRGGVVR